MLGEDVHPATEQLPTRARCLARLREHLAWADRMLLPRAGDRLSERAVHRLDRVFAPDDPTGEIGAAGGVKERIRMLFACTDLDAADTARGQLGITVLAADMPETWRLRQDSPVPNRVDVFRYRNIMAARGTSSDDVGRVQRDRRAAAPGHPGAAAGG